MNCLLFIYNFLPELGQGAVLRFEAATEARLREEMQLILEEKRKMFEAEKRRAVEIIIEKTRKECDERIELSRKEFEKKLQVEHLNFIR